MDESMGGRGRSALYVGCVYMPTDSTSVAAVDAGYVSLKEVITFRLKGKVMLLGDFNARVGHFLVWMELGRTPKNFKEKRVIRRLMRMR